MPRRGGSPLNATIEVGGPEQFRLDELVRRALAESRDSREVVTDSSARCYGIKLSERTLVPSDDAQLGQTRFDDWLNQPTVPIPANNQLPAVVAAPPKGL